MGSLTISRRILKNCPKLDLLLKIQTVIVVLTDDHSQPKIDSEGNPIKIQGLTSKELQGITFLKDKMMTVNSELVLLKRWIMKWKISWPIMIL